MKKQLTRALSIVLTITMLLTAAPFLGFAGLDFKLPTLPRLRASAQTEYAVGDIIRLGTYPQSKVTDTATLEALNGLTLNWESYGYYSGNGNIGSMEQSDFMRYADVTYGGTKYRAVTFDSNRPYWTHTTSSNTYQTTSGYSANTTYWFRYDPLQWRILDPVTGLVLCETIIDSQAYSNLIYAIDKNGNGSIGNDEYFNDAAGTNYANDYATSSIRTWLNEDFYNTAFTATEQANIQTTALDNSAGFGNTQYDSDPTNDKIFMLSYNESKNAAYGFNTSYSNFDPVRRAQGSDYAKAQGLFVYRGDNYYGNSDWGLRSPGNSSEHACDVNRGGYVHYDVNINYAALGVRPAMVLNPLPVNVTGVTLDADAASLLVDGTKQLTATVEPADATNPAVTWTSSDESVATVDANGLVTAVGLGTAIITVITVDGDFTDTCAITVSPDLNGNDTPDDLDPSYLVSYGAGINGTLSGGLESEWVLWGMAPANVPTPVPNPGYAFAGWTSAIPAQVFETAFFVAVFAPATYTTNITAPDNTEAEAEAEATYGEDYTIVIIPGDGYLLPTDIDISIGGEPVADEDFTYNPATGEIVIEGDVITDGTIVIEGFAIPVVPTTGVEILLNGESVDSVVYDSDEALVFTAVVSPADATYPAVTWTSSDPAVATIDETGAVTVVSYGVVTITCETGDGFTDTVTVTIEAVGVTGISIPGGDVYVAVGDTTQIVATLEPANASITEIVWTSSDETVATVDENGVVTGVAGGECVITATTVSGSYTATVRLFVYEAGKTYVATLAKSNCGTFLIGDYRFYNTANISVNAGQPLRFQFAVKSNYDPSMVTVTVNGRMLQPDAENYFTIPNMTENVIIIATGNGNIDWENIPDTDAPTDDTCWCHSSNAVLRFFWKIILFFCKLFGIESYHYCKCGAAHW